MLAIDCFNIRTSLHLIFPLSICFVVIVRMCASHKGQLIEVTCTRPPSDSVSSAVHRLVPHVRTCGPEETDISYDKKEKLSVY